MNLRDRDNLGTKNNRPIPKVSFVQRFNCTSMYIHYTIRACNINFDEKVCRLNFAVHKDSTLSRAHPRESCDLFN